MPDAAGAELRRTQAALTGVSGALLFVRLLRGAGDFRHPLGLVIATAAFRQLPVDDTRHDVFARLDLENVVGQFGAAGGGILKRDDIDLHLPVPQPATGASTSAAG